MTHARHDVHEADRPADPMRRDIGLHHRAKTTAVDIRNPRQIEDDMAAPRIELTANRLLQIRLGFDRQPVRQFEHHHIRRDVFEDLHRKSPAY